MPIYNVSIEIHPVCEEYRIEADSLEEAKEKASEVFYDRMRDIIAYEVDGVLSDDQETRAHFNAKDVL